MPLGWGMRALSPRPVPDEHVSDLTHEMLVSRAIWKTCIIDHASVIRVALTVRLRGRWWVRGADTRWLVLVVYRRSWIFESWKQSSSSPLPAWGETFVGVEDVIDELVLPFFFLVLFHIHVSGFWM
jgi:hypothetical protein